MSLGSVMLMNKRRLLLVVILLAMAAVGWLALYLTAPVRLNARTIERVRLAHDRAEVEAILGKPSGEYSKNGLRWRDGGTGLMVDFDESGKVLETTVLDLSGFEEPSFLERIRNWLGL
jgi:hypothetical protein